MLRQIKTNYNPGEKLKLRVYIGDKANERNKVTQENIKTRIFTVVKQYPHGVLLKYPVANGIWLTTFMTPWQIADTMKNGK